MPIIPIPPVFGVSSLPTFTWIPSYGTPLDWKPNLNEISYGDGYEQSMPAGINNVPLHFTNTFRSVSSVEAAQISAFLQARGATSPFFWTPPAPYNLAGLIWKCKQFQHTYDQANGETIVAEFMQTFNAS